MCSISTLKEMYILINNNNSSNNNTIILIFNRKFCNTQLTTLNTPETHIFSVFTFVLIFRFFLVYKLVSFRSNNMFQVPQWRLASLCMCYLSVPFPKFSWYIPLLNLIKKKKNFKKFRNYIS